MITLMWIGLVLNAPHREAAAGKGRRAAPVRDLAAHIDRSNWTVTLDDGTYLAVSRAAAGK